MNDDEIIENVCADRTTSTRVSGASRLKGRGQHTLDSDEEDETVVEEKQEAGHLPYEAIVGQLEGEACVDAEGVRFTAFNMREELEEGHFDMQGNYIFNRENELRDNWLDNIDWVQVKQVEKVGNGKRSHTGGLADSSSDEEDVENTDRVTAKSSEYDLWQDILPLMKPGETVARAIRRLGGGSGGSSTKWRVKRQKQSKQAESCGADVDREAMLKLSGLADKLVSLGDMDVYDTSYERFMFLVKQEAQRKLKASSAPEFDMFSDAAVIDSERAAPLVTADETKEVRHEVLWEYCASRVDDADDIKGALFGPFNSQQMLDFSERGFPCDSQHTAKEMCGPQPEALKEVFVRRVGQQKDFYSSKRIDFDLYI